MSIPETKLACLKSFWVKNMKYIKKVFRISLLFVVLILLCGCSVNGFGVDTEPDSLKVLSPEEIESIFSEISYGKGNNRYCQKGSGFFPLNLFESCKERNSDSQSKRNGFEHEVNDILFFIRFIFQRICLQKFINGNFKNFRKLRKGVDIRALDKVLATYILE